ncbi:zinc finger protein 808-like [Haliotis rubra]|uniref:zinc finger protein 808-like n=1 Tax=Haliotis rubra TaxID=36100 RepID=UPI001EE50B95|nr:zinc finger protein 808-like [Haliotis rubra]XP_046576267.1 zinc finger protein 808-like [Haliotis rubra]
MAEGSASSSNRHSRIKLECEICHKVFYRHDVFRCHMRIHSGIKPYSCDVCGKRFAHYGNRDQHAAIHASSATFVCELCGNTLTSQIYLNRHIKRHHPTHYTPCKRGQVQPERRCSTTFFKQKFSDVPKQTDSQNVVESDEVRIYLPPTFAESEKKDSSLDCTNQPYNGEGAMFHLLCKYCGQQFEQRHKYQLHIMEHELEELGKSCSFCNILCSNLAEKRIHELSHTEKERNSNGSFQPKHVHPSTVSPQVISPGSFHPKHVHPTTVSPQVISPGLYHPKHVHPTTVSPQVISPGLYHPI